MRNVPQRHADELEQALGRLYPNRQEPPASFEAGWRAAVQREERTVMATKSTASARIWKTLAPICAALVLTVGSVWVGATQPGLQDTNAAVTRQSAKLSPAGNSAYEEMADYDYAAMSDVAMYDAAPAEGADYGMARGLSSNATSGSTAGSAAPDPAATERKLVRTADLTIRTTAFDEDVRRVTQLLESLGGYVEDLYQHGDAEQGRTRTRTMSMRVPSAKLDAFLEGVSGVGRVTDRSESVTDMTVQYADNAARLQTLRDKMERLNTLLKQAENVSDLIEIESAIADTQYQIDSYETRQRSIDRRVDMSAVNVTLMEETPAQSAAAEDVTLGERVRAALSASVKGVGVFLRNMLVFVVMALPVLVPVGVAALIIWLAARRKRARRERKEE